MARSDSRPMSGNNSENNSRPTSKDARHRRDRQVTCCCSFSLLMCFLPSPPLRVCWQETPFPNESSSHSGELLSGVDDDERSMRRPKPVFRARALSGPVVALDVPLPDGGTAPTAAAQDTSPGPTGLDLSASVAAAVAAVSHGAADDPYNSARGTAAGPDGGNDGGSGGEDDDEEEYSTSFGFGGKRAPSKRPSAKAIKAK